VYKLADAAWRRRDVALALVLAAGTVLELTLGPITPPGYVGHAWVHVLATTALIGASLLRRRLPRGYLLVVTLATTASWTQVRGLGELPWPGFACLLAAAYTVGAHRSLADGAASLAAAATGWAALDLYDRQSGLVSVHRDVGFYLLAALAFAAGVGVRTLRSHNARYQELLKELARERSLREAGLVAEERRRIARDVHDILTHTMSAVAVQAAAARTALTSSPQLSEAGLRTVESTAREALTDLRRLLGALRDTDDDHLAPTPGLADIEALVHTAESTGLTVERSTRGSPVPVSPGVELTAYRIVQEALTNVVRHAGASAVQVEVSYAVGTLTISVADNGVRRHPAGSGHGLVGMRERVALYDGELTIGPRSEGGWQVKACLPTPR
jgi:signal transduction histidine kinase